MAVAAARIYCPGCRSLLQPAAFKRGNSELPQKAAISAPSNFTSRFSQRTALLEVRASEIDLCQIAESCSRALAVLRPYSRKDVGFSEIATVEFCATGDQTL